MQVDKVAKLSDHGNCEFEYGEFEFGGEQFEEHISYKGEGEGSTIGGIG